MNTKKLMENEEIDTHPNTSRNIHSTLHTYTHTNWRIIYPITIYIENSR